MHGSSPADRKSKPSSSLVSFGFESLEDRLTPTVSPLQYLLAIQPFASTNSDATGSSATESDAQPTDNASDVQATASSAEYVWSGAENFNINSSDAQVAPNQDGRLEAFSLTSDGSLYHRWQVAPNGTWSAWSKMGSGYSSINVAKNADGRLEVFAIGTNGRLYQTWQVKPNGTWSAFSQLAGSFKSVEVVTNRDGRLEAFLLGTDNAIYQRWQTAPNGTWSAVNRWGGSYKYVEVEINKDGRLELFALGTDGVINQRWQLSPNSSWSDWNKLSGKYTDLSVGSNVDGRLEMFAVGTDKALYQRWQTAPNGSWSAWNNLGGDLKEVELTRAADGGLSLFAISNAGRLINRWQVVTGKTWSAWHDLGAAKNNIRVASNADGRLEVFWNDTSGRMYHRWQTFDPITKDYKYAWNIDAMHVQDVWNQGYSGQGVIVAVLDTGVDLDHVDLIDNVWTNAGEIPGNGIDDDKNGYIDDVHGWDFVTYDNNTDDQGGHGTHVAGIIAGESNGYGVTGIAPNATIMPVQVLNSGGTGSSTDIARGIRYAIDNGAKIINISLGGEYNNPAVTDALKYAQSKGVLIIAGSGNDSANMPLYPAAYSATFNNVLSVGAYDSSYVQTATTNNVGSSGAVQVDAPGVDIYSTIPQDLYRFMTGTSMAAPQVTGLAALLLSANPSLTGSELRDIIVKTATKTITGSDSVGGVDAKAALDLALSSKYV